MQRAQSRHLSLRIKAHVRILAGVDLVPLRDYAVAMHALVRLFAIAVLFFTHAFAGDWPHYRGPAQNGSTTESIGKLPVGGPRELWRVQLGTGLSSITVADGRVFSAGYRDGKEVLQCLSPANGRVLWTHSWAAKLGDYLFEGGPRATPTVDGERVYMLGADGHIACVTAAGGKPLWEKNLVSDFGGRRPEWGFSGSPTIDGKNVILDCGGKGASTVALDKLTGAPVWKSGDDEAGYGSLVVAQIGGVRRILILKSDALVMLNVADGVEAGRFEWKTSYKINAATPLLVGDRAVISSAYNHGAAAVSLTGGKPSQVWFTKNLHTHFNSPVHSGGFVFGMDGEAGHRRAALVCLDLATGDEKWRAKSVNNGSLIVAGDKLLILTESGDLVLAAASGAGYRELARKKVLSGRCWVQPTLANGRVYCRNNTGELVALDLGGK
jgi:outer membrane protein assembly factor BamB